MSGESNDKGSTPGEAPRSNDKGPVPGSNTRASADKGSLLDDEPIASTSGIVSLDMFGNEIRPAAPDRVAGGDKGRSYSAETPAVQETKSEYSSTPSKTEEKRNSSSAGSSKKLGLIVAAGLAVCTVVVLLYKVSTGGISGGALSANEIFRTCSPSLVTLYIATKAMIIKIGGVTILTDDGEPLLITLNDGHLALYKDGKPTDSVEGILEIKGMKVPVLVRMGSKLPLVYIKSKGRLHQLNYPLDLVAYSQTAIGSGFFVKPGVVATNFHVVSDGDLGVAAFTGGVAQIPGKAAKYIITDKPIAFDKEHDLALVYIPGTDAKPMTLEGDYEKLRVGQAVFALGSPKGLDGSISEGLISSDKLRGVAPTDPSSAKLYIQHSAKIDHGNSGGPLVDVHGNVVGVNTAGLGNGAINLAVTAKFVEDLLKRPDVQVKIDELNKQGGTDLHG